ncbi:hypothetical protein ES707_12850 [subsurface metagenome]
MSRPHSTRFGVAAAHVPPMIVERIDRALKSSGQFPLP